MLDAGVANEVVTDGVILGNNAAGVAHVSVDREVEVGAVVDFVDGHQGAFEHLASHGLIGPGLRANNANWNRRLGHLWLPTTQRPDQNIIAHPGARSLADLLRSGLAKFVQFFSLTWRGART
jgi:hypothetical protein